MSLPEDRIKVEISTKWKRYAPLNSGHEQYTLEFFKSNPHYNDLPLALKIYAEMHWTKRYCNHSIRELAQDLNMKKSNVQLFLNLLEFRGKIAPERKFWKNTNIPARTHKPLTRDGRDLMDATVQFAWKGTEIPEWLSLGIVFVDGVPKLEEHLSPSDKRKLEKQAAYPPIKNKFEVLDKQLFETETTVKKIVHTLERLSFLGGRITKKNKLRKPAASGLFSFENERVSLDWGIWGPSLFDSGATLAENLANLYLKLPSSAPPWPETEEYKRRKTLKQEYDKFKTCARRKIFESFGFAREYDEEMHIGIWRSLEDEPIPKICKALKLVRKKLETGKFRMRSFTGFFTHLMKNPQNMGYNAFLAQLYRDAIDGKDSPGTEKMIAGLDSSEFIDIARKLESETGEKIPVKTLGWLQSVGDIQVWRRAIEAVDFRKRLDKERSGKTRLEDVFENIEKRSTYEQEVAVRDEKGKLKRDENGTILWELKTFTKSWMERTLVGQKEVPVEGEIKSPEKKVSSWVGLWVYSVKLGSVEKINKRFFSQKPAEEKKMPRLPGSPPKADLSYELVDDEPERGAMPKLPGSDDGYGAVPV